MANFIRTRIAPAPTGLLHVGTARTALFNFIFAKQAGGEFILRFEDTDRSRSTKVAAENIAENLEWLGLAPDEGPFRQMNRLKLYKSYAERLKNLRAVYEKDGALWFRVGGSTGAVEWSDLIHGRQSVPISALKDFVIVRANGIPTYNFVVVVDDIEMRITHVIRGDDHLPNTPKQILIYRALDAKSPEFGHLPLILGPDKKKLSKRHGAQSIGEFREAGFIPEAIVNFLALLGWAPGDDQEFLTFDQLLNLFSLEKVHPSPAVFDIEKLTHFNAHYLHELDLGELAERIRGWAEYAKVKLPKTSPDYFLQVVATIQDRLRLLSEFPKLTSYFFSEPKYKQSLLIFKKSTKKSTKKGLSAAIFALEKLPGWGRDQVEESLSSVVQKEGLTNGDVFWPVRSALSGSEGSPSPVDLLEVLGKEKSLRRLRAALKKL
jgi:glutamyl-tRNA synthetase